MSSKLSPAAHNGKRSASAGRSRFPNGNSTYGNPSGPVSPSVRDALKSKLDELRGLLKDIDQPLSKPKPKPRSQPVFDSDEEIQRPKSEAISSPRWRSANNTVISPVRRRPEFDLSMGAKQVQERLDNFIQQMEEEKVLMRERMRELEKENEDLNRKNHLQKVKMNMLMEQLRVLDPKERQQERSSNLLVREHRNYFRDKEKKEEMVYQEACRQLAYERMVETRRSEEREVKQELDTRQRQVRERMWNIKEKMDVASNGSTVANGSDWAATIHAFRLRQFPHLD
eukprot:GILK01008952.1.p1 GENE.GILK01008952.1~~GILK01008952.1.p1  ORF type:complete len:284 (+),score=54.70 GILK01008952.1:48-899(+)